MSEPRTVSIAEAARLMASAVRSKYGNRRTFVAELGRTFDSQHEAEQAVILRRREQAGEIRDLRFQESFDLRVHGQSVGRYVADFVFEEYGGVWLACVGAVSPPGWHRVVADAKGVRTPVYRLKKRLMDAIYGLEIQEL